MRRIKLIIKNRTTLKADIMVSGEVKAEGSAIAGCHSDEEFEKPSITLTVEPCTPGQLTRDVTAVVGNPNDAASAGTIKFGSRNPVPFGSIAAGGSSAPIVFQDVSPGTYAVTATLTEFNTTFTTSVTVVECPPPADNPPSMQCQGPQHIYVGDDAMFADFDLTDPDGNPVSFGEPVVTGPLDVVLVEDSAVAGGKRRTVGIRAKQIPEGTSQNATLKVTGSAGGKSVSCTVNIMVVNEDTGW